MTALKKYRNTTDVAKPLNSRQVVNSTGGFVFEVDDKSRLERFLILGVDGGTYYVSEEDLTKQNVDWLQALIRRDPALVLSAVLDVSTSGRAYRNSAAIFVLALVLNVGDDASKQKAVALTPMIARTATHVFELATYIKNLGGWGRSKRRAIASWFTSKNPDQLSYQAVKYRQRDGWTLRDLMRLSHPIGVDRTVGNFILGGVTDVLPPKIIVGFQTMQKVQTLGGVLATLNVYANLPWETIPTQFLKEPEVWKKLFYNNQLKGQALVRNIVRLQKIGAFEDHSFVVDVAATLSDPEMIEHAKLHPMNFLNTSIVYTQGQIDRAESYVYGLSRNKTWTVNRYINASLEAGFYASFNNVNPSNKRILVGLDVSGSMSWSSSVGSDLSAAQGGAAMAMILARTEPDTLVYGFANTFRDLNISPSMSFSQIMSRTANLNFGSTDMSLPMTFAQQKNLGIETFVVITDNEVNRGGHPSQVLKNYRQATGIDARLAVMAMTPTPFTIADPLDMGMLDVVGFDSNAPKVVSDFSAGRF